MGAMLISCSKVSNTENMVEVVENGTTLINPDFKIDLEYIGTIKSDDTAPFGQASNIDIDSKGDIYLTEQYKLIHKYDSNGNFIKSIGKNGNGPGEYSYLITSFVSMDTIYAIDAMTQKAIKYDLNGNYLSDFPLNGSFPGMVYTVGDKMIGLIVKQKMVENKPQMNYYLSTLNRDISSKKVLFEDSLIIDPNNMSSMMDMGMMAMLVTLDKDGYYMAESSENRFKINFYDRNGDLKREIKKNYAKTPFSQEEIDLANKTIDEMLKNSPNPEIAGTMKFDKKYKKAIDEIRADHLNRLWVRGGRKEIQSFDSPLKYDIFKDGKFINNISLMDNGEPLLMSGQTIILGDKLCLTDMKNSQVKLYKILN